MKNKATPVDLDKVLKQFTQVYLRAGLGIMFIGKTSNGLKVVIKSAANAEKIPAEFSGVPVTVYQDLGLAGQKLIIRDKNGKVTGFQG